MAQRRWLYWQAAQGIRVAILYYKDAGSSRSVWLQDDGGAPVQIALWPKRIPLGWSGSLVVGSGGLIKGRNIGRWWVGGLDHLSDEPIPTFNTSGSISTPQGFFYLGAFVYNQSRIGTVEMGVDPQDTFPDGEDSVGFNLNVEGQPEIGENAQVTFIDTANFFGVDYLLKTPEATIFSLYDEPARRLGSIRVFPSTAERLWYGTANNVQQLTRPTNPALEAEDFNNIQRYRPQQSYTNVNTLQDGSSYTFQGDPSSLIGAVSAAVTVVKFTPGVGNEVLQATIKGVDADAVKVIAVSAIEA